MSRIIGKFRVAPTEEDYRDAAYDGVWYPVCPYCGVPTPAEPDADKVCCQSCGKKFKLESIV